MHYSTRYIKNVGMTAYTRWTEQIVNQTLPFVYKTGKQPWVQTPVHPGTQFIVHERVSPAKKMFL